MALILPDSSFGFVGRWFDRSGTRRTCFPGPCLDERFTFSHKNREARDFGLTAQLALSRLLSQLCSAETAGVFCRPSGTKRRISPLKFGDSSGFSRFEHPSTVTLLRGKCRPELIIIKRKGEIETVSSRGITQSELSTSANRSLVSITRSRTLSDRYRIR